MAASDVPTRQGDPYLSHRFRIELDDLVVAGVSEVSGLGMEIETEQYQEGGINTHVHTLPKRVTYPNLTFRRGVFDSALFSDWIGTALTGSVERKHGRVILLDSTGQPAACWAFWGAYPISWSGPDLQADQGAVAMESVEIAHEGLAKGA